ncbi:reverse transcriptase domain-containing protein [Tanacetum coccineum]
MTCFVSPQLITLISSEICNISSSMSAAQNQTDLLLNQLELGVTGTIVVMICRMWDVHAATGRYLSTDFIVPDTKGNVMHCTAKGNIAHNFLRLKEGSIYSVKNFTVVPNKDEFRVIRFAEFMLEFDGETTVRKSFLKSDGFTHYPFQLVEIDELEPTKNKYLIDDVGYVTNVGRITQTRTGSKTLDFYMANCRGQQIRVTCKSQYVLKFKQRLPDSPLVDWLYLSSTSSTLIIDDEKIPLLMWLKTNDSGVELTKEILLEDNTTPKAGTLENLLMYRLKLEISDETTEVVVVMFDETMRVLLKCSANSILDCKGQVYFSAPFHFTNTFTDLRMQDEEASLGLPTALANIVGTSHTLELKSHTYYEHGITPPF